MVKTFVYFVVYQNDMLVRFNRLLDAVRFRRDSAKNAQIARVSEYSDSQGIKIYDVEKLI